MEDIASLRLRIKESLIRQECSCEPSKAGGKLLDLLSELFALANQKTKVDFRRFLDEKNGLGKKQRNALREVGFVLEDVENSFSTPRNAGDPSKKNYKIIKETIVSFKAN